AYGLDKGALRWTSPAGAPFFAPAALSADTAYVADLGGVIYSLNLKTGVPRWKLDAGPPGMVYAGPTLDGGRLYVATCNLAGKHAGKPTAVICIGDE
ncbi:MAG: PQQ-binding-like beta-propeller repeat protein, partial [Gemmataceae bacterium]